MNAENIESIIKRLGTEIRLQSVNYLEASPGISTNLHIHPDLLHIVYIVGGKGICLLEGKKYVFVPGMLHVVYPNEAHRYIVDRENPYKVYFIHINWMGQLPEFPRFVRINKKGFEKLLKELTDLCHNDKSPGREIRKAALLCTVLADLFDIYYGGEGGEKSPYAVKKEISNIFSRLQSPPFVFPGIDELSASVNMCRRSFTKFFRESTGMSVFDYHMKAKMTYARNLIEAKEFKLKEIAFQCGYRNSQNFLRAYKSFYSIES
ncbi:MAG: hypothetical protein A2017_10170 [Lentisphaerae bacterium GWF2_44_16]|nr:MAG: hypothetical protein A2017_10170 [Lentisphaerae bacterium GWF2_44_16]